jgi:hypothetical protein
MGGYLVNHITQMIITLVIVIGAYVALVVTGYGDAAIDLRLPMVALITAIAGASPGPVAIPASDLREKRTKKED